jgi:hypothetical protein
MTTSRSDFIELTWNLSFDGPWSAEAVAVYIGGGYDGLALVPSRRAKLADLDFVRELTGLRSLEVSSRMSNDVAAFEVDTLERLTLVTGSRRPIPGSIRQPAMRSLCLTARPGLDDVAAAWPTLERLRLDFYSGTDLRFLGNAGSLRELEIWGRRQSGVLDGIEAGASLRRLKMANLAVEDSAPLAALQGELIELKLLSAPPGPSHGRISFADLQDAPLQKIWISQASTLLDLEALASLNRLRELRLLHCRLDDTDRAALTALPGRVQVELVDCD